jgi:IS5 family transposase
MARRRIGQKQLALHGAASRGSTSLDAMASMMDWAELDRLLAGISSPSKGAQGWPPLALFRALLLATWHGLSDVWLADSLDDRASFHRFCRCAASEPTPERTAFVRFRAQLVRRGLDRALFKAVAN